MEQQLIDFVAHHWSLWLAFAAVIGLILINEYLIKKKGPTSLSPSAVVSAINHSDATVIDIRDVEPFRQEHIVGAKNIPGAPLDKLQKYQSKPFVLVCARGLQSAPLAAKLRKQGFTDVMVLTGGITAWKTASLPLVKGKK
jgi:rhodanese-related sulfurtransferase